MKFLKWYKANFWKMYFRNLKGVAISFVLVLGIGWIYNRMLEWQVNRIDPKNPVLNRADIDALWAEYETNLKK